MTYANKNTSLAGYRLANRQMHRKHRAIFALCLHIPANTDNFGLAACIIIVNITIVLCGMLPGHQHTDILANTLGSIIAK